MTSIDITVERPLSGGILLSCVAGNQYYKQIYFFYTIAEAKKLFRSYVKQQLASC